MVVGRCDDALLELVGDVGVLVCVCVFILTGDFPSWYFATRDWGGLRVLYGAGEFRGTY